MIVHRAVLGSCERMIAILTEHWGGKWPFWLSPRQVMIIPVHESFDDYCLQVPPAFPHASSHHITLHSLAFQVKDELFRAGFEAEVDLDQSDTMNRKIRNAQLAQFNFILVIGAQERDNATVNVRTRDNKAPSRLLLPSPVSKGEWVQVRGELTVPALIQRFNKFTAEKTIDNEADWE